MRSVRDVVMVGSVRMNADSAMTHGHRAAPAPAAGWSRQPPRISTLIGRRRRLARAYLTPDVATASAAGTAISETLIWISSFTPTPR